MKTLMILRHGKSSWSDPALADHDRPLKRRGERGARAIGEQLRDRGLVPDLVLSSTARRARDTAERCLAACGAAAPLVRTEELYGTGIGRHLELVRREAGDAHRSVMVVGHNPDLEALVARLSGESVRLKTAHLAVVELPIDAWSELGAGGGTLRLHLEPA